MVVTVFRSRLRADVPQEFDETAARLSQLAGELPGFIEYKTFQAADGERVSLVSFESPAALRAWREHPEHRAAQQRGRERFYESYSIHNLEGESRPRCWEREA